MDRRPLKRKIVNDIGMRGHFVAVPRDPAGDLHHKTGGPEGVQLREHQPKHDVNGRDIENARASVIIPLCLRQRPDPPLVPQVLNLLPIFRARPQPSAALKHALERVFGRERPVYRCLFVR
jgi:hypothetical protein